MIDSGTLNALRQERREMEEQKRREERGTLTDILVK
jgi:hypothetical protein